MVCDGCACGDWNRLIVLSATPVTKLSVVGRSAALVRISRSDVPLTALLLSTMTPAPLIVLSASPVVADASTCSMPEKVLIVLSATPDADDVVVPSISTVTLPAATAFPDGSVRSSHASTEVIGMLSRNTNH